MNRTGTGIWYLTFCYSATAQKTWHLPKYFVKVELEFVLTFLFQVSYTLEMILRETYRILKSYFFVRSFSVGKISQDHYLAE
jgi:hypothetical protein